MDDYAGRVLVDRYRLPLPPSDEFELTESRAFDTYSGQEVLVRQVPLPEVVEAEVLDAEGLPEGFTARDRGARRPGSRGVGVGAGTRRPADPVVRRAMEAAQATASIPDHPRLDQVFDVFAEGGSLWIVSELVAARPLSALLAEKPLTPYRAAEVASDVLMALRVLHGHGWVHRNITARTVLVCDDGRVMLTGLAVGAAEEALCGYDPVPAPDATERGPGVAGRGNGGAGHGGSAVAPRASATAPRQDGPGALVGPAGPGGPGGFGGFGGSAGVGPGGIGPGGGGTGAGAVDPEAARRAAIEARGSGALPVPAGEPSDGGAASGAVARREPAETGGDIRAARAGAIAAYRAGARAAARVQEAQEAQQNGRAALPGARTPADESRGTPAGGPPGQIADPYGVSGAPVPGPVGYGQGQPAHVHAAGPGPGGAPYAVPQAPHPSLTPVPGAQVPAQGQSQGPSGEARGGSRWDEPVAGAPGSAARRGPATALAAERARQARMAVVGPVTERWAPEQAGPVHENWQLAAPIGPATDLWALGALLFRAVQGHAPYPEESTAELVQMVCAEPPAFAEECGPLRPVVESLLRQDPTERLDFEELRGWLRSLVRSAPEPEAGTYVVAAPPTDPRRLPIVRRRGELVRRRRAGLPATHGRHKRGRPEPSGSPRSLGRTLLVLILLLLAGAIAYAVMFMPKADEEGAAGTDGSQRTGATGSQGGQAPEASSEPRPDQTSPGGASPSSGSSGAEATQTQNGGSGTDVADGFTVRTDDAGFRVAVANGWDRTPKNGRGQVVYAHGDFELIVVPGRDSAASNGGDPMVYQREKESELQPYRDSSWATASGLRTTTVGARTMAEGQFTWTDADGRALYVRNVAILISGRYHIVQVRGPEAERDEVTRLFEQASATYQYTG
ncbi:serine/threonine protein kinase [Streptomyces sp. 3330]|uniref:protein kinase n=1 Tax=Streptomyces sp. 3330 TaxID=2817755 RepID=UPI00285FCA7C|nr:protein kinase [Streptomyces sp. 3330]MDR6975495.1 serine/threonine protein kinase [Streptomyces sp. 3330]